MSETLMELHRMLTESLARDEELSEQLRALTGSVETDNKPLVQIAQPNLDLQGLTQALIECMEDTVTAINEVQTVLDPVDNNNNSLYFPNEENDGADIVIPHN